MNALAVSDFAEYFRAVHGVDPYPWQQRLLEFVYREKRWPALLDLPTGSGKTSSLDVATFALALDAHSSPETRWAPRRIAIVVDRRTIVDQTFMRARKIADALASAPDDGAALGRVASALRRVAGSDATSPLAAVVLRGGLARDDGWAHSPTQPALIVSTVDQVGSRMLFRGYGVSQRMQPVHAGLFANDVLLLLDEVHLSTAFDDTLRYLERYRQHESSAIPQRWHVARLSATAETAQGDVRFELDAADRSANGLRQRLNSPKPVKCVAVAPNEFDKRVVELVRNQLQRRKRLGVVVNTVRTARAIYKELERSFGAAGRRDAEPSADVRLVTGRMRPLDRETLEAELAAALRPDAERQHPIIVVATQCIEAGADYDFDWMLCECATIDALVQRFGRLDRAGLTADCEGVIVYRKESDDPVYGAASSTTWQWLQQAAQGGVISFGAGFAEASARADAGKKKRAECRADAIHAPVLLPAVLDAWAQTSPPRQSNEPDVALWLHGVRRPEYNVSVVWRRDVSESLLQSDPEEAVERVVAMPPLSSEALEVPLWAARAWLRRLVDDGTIADVPLRGEEASDGNATKEKATGASRCFVRWSAGDRSAVVSDDSDAIRSGDTIIVPCDYGGLLSGTWDPSNTHAVSDLAERAWWTQRATARLRATKATLEAVFPWLFADDVDALDGLQLEPETVEEPEETEEDACDRWLDALKEQHEASPRAETDRPWANSLLQTLVDDRAVQIVRVGLRGAVLVKPAARAAPTTEGTDADDEASSFTGVEVSLADHLEHVGKRAERYAKQLGIDERLAKALYFAGLMHDLGKIDPEFQRLLRGGDPRGRTVIAKSPRRTRTVVATSFPRGGRHEMFSVALMTDDALERLGVEPTERELVRYLVGTHHGYGRPFAPVVDDHRRDDERARWTLKGVVFEGPVKHNLESPGSGVAERFWAIHESLGVFSTAWLEAILRLADHRESEREASDEK